jgi:hypothetical protein
VTKKWKTHLSYKYGAVLEAMEPGKTYYVPEFVALINRTLGRDWAGDYNMLMKPAVRRGLVEKVPLGPYRNSSSAYRRVR